MFHRAGGSGLVCPVLAGPLIVKKLFFFFFVLFSSQVILYIATEILCCLYLECKVQYIYHANSENVLKIAYLGI